MIIPGNTVGTTVPRADYGQTDESQSSFILNKPDAAILKAQQTADSGKQTAEAALPRSGGVMEGPLTVVEPESPGHAASKGYVDSLHRVFTLTLIASGWTGEGPYTQTVALPGILASDTPHYGIVYSDNWEAEREAFSLVDDLDTGDESLTFTCFEEKPEADISIQLEVNR